ncbi:MAG: bifunctional helix-turn-helix transcriptional regulator/GNAT family N-acetyltransferase [Polyangiaceae bacterium]
MARALSRAPSSVDRVRRFNRFYTRLIGVLDEGHLQSAYSLADVRVLYELAHRSGATASEIGGELGLDAGYLSRILRSFEQRKLLRRIASKNDARQNHLRLTLEGRSLFATIDARARDAIIGLFAPLDDPSQRKIVDAMDVIKETFEGTPRERAQVSLRTHRPGDMGAVIARQAILYATEYGWNEEYEALTARITADFLDDFDPTREICFIAEQEATMVGCVFLIRHPERESVAKLRLLYVEPQARGQGVGKRLVRECTTFARGAGYRTITLWTNDVLVSARRIYEAEGYRLVKEEKHRSFGKELVGQTWEMRL